MCETQGHGDMDELKKNFKVSSIRNPPHEYSQYWRDKQKLLIITTHTQKQALISVSLCCSVRGQNTHWQRQVRAGRGTSATVGSSMCDKQWLWQHWTDRTGLSEQLHVKACENSRLQRREEKRRLLSALFHTHHSFGGYCCTTWQLKNYFHKEFPTLC